MKTETTKTIEWAMAEGSQLLKKRDLAARLGLCSKSVERLVQRGMPCYRLGYKTVRFRWDEVLDWLDKNHRFSVRYDVH